MINRQTLFQECYLLFPKQQEVCYVVDKIKVRKIFEGQVEFDQQEMEILKQFETYLISKRFMPKWTEPQLLRMLYATKFKFDKTYAAIQAYIQWKNQAFPLKENQDTSKFLSSGSIYLHGRDNRFRPIIVVNAVKLAAQKNIDITLDSMTIFLEHVLSNYMLPGQIENWQWINSYKTQGCCNGFRWFGNYKFAKTITVKSIRLSIKQLSFQNAQMLCNQLSQYYLLKIGIHFQDLFFILFFGLISYLGIQFSIFYQNNYYFVPFKFISSKPKALYKLKYFQNTSNNSLIDNTITFSWNIVKGFLEEITVRKISFEKSNIPTGLFEHSHKSQVEQKYGGVSLNIDSHFWPPKEISQQYFLPTDNISDILISKQQYNKLYEVGKLSKNHICKELLEDPGQSNQNSNMYQDIDKKMKEEVSIMQNQIYKIKKSIIPDPEEEQQVINHLIQSNQGFYQTEVEEKYDVVFWEETIQKPLSFHAHKKMLKY